MKTIINTEDDIALYTNLGSVAELSRVQPSEFTELLGIELQEPVFWFSRLKARTEGIGEGTKLMVELVRVLDQRKATVINGVNPYGNLSLSELIKFYQKYGFKYLKDGIMIRFPTKG